jgi:hypothetical protein
MGCNCKNVQKVENKLINANHVQNTKKGVMNILNKFTVLLKQILIKLGVVLLLFILTPIVIIVISYTFLFKDSAYFPINSDFVKKLSKLDE